jgi:hypothetical protein
MPRSQTANIGVYDFGASVGPILGTAASASVTLSTVVDTNTVTLSDGTLTKVFEFDSNSSVTGTNIAVTIGADDTSAAAALAVAINASGLKMSATSALGVTTITAITAEFNEAAGNAYTTAKSGSPVTVTAFTGGINGNSASVVLRFRVKHDQGGKLDLKFENAIGENAMTVSVQVATSPTGLTPTSPNGGYAATTAGNNLAAVTNLSVPKRTSKEATILLRRGVDRYVRVLATGSCRGQLQIRGDQILEPVRI